jgi:cob(I)alamin adenosyltransferase
VNPDSTAGLVIVLTGDGKGKTTSALGQALRAVGQGMRVAVVQFVKARAAGEHTAAEGLAPALEIHRMGRGFVPTEGQIGEEHRQAAEEALGAVRRLLADGRHEMVIADEILLAVDLGLIGREAVETLVAQRPEPVHLVLTGRGAWEGIIDAADLVTRMENVKHPHDGGAAARAGIEF